jgi:MFS family permease
MRNENRGILSETPPSYKWQLVALLWVAFFLHQGNRQIYNVVLPLIKSGLSLSDVQAGLVQSVFTAIYGVCVPLAGFAGDRLRRKWQILMSVLVFSTGTLLTGLGGGVMAFIVFYGLATGGGEAFYYPAATSLLGQFHDKSRATALSIHQTALYAGITFSGFFSGYIGQNWGWRMPFYLFGGAGLLWACVLMPLMRDTPSEKRSSLARMPIGETLAHILGKRSAIALACAFGCMVYVGVGFHTWMPTYLHEKFGFALDKAGFSAVFYHYICAFFGVLFGGRLTDRWAARRQTIRFEANAVGLLLGAPFIFLMTQTSSEVLCFVMLGLFGFFRGIYDSNLFASLFDVIKPQYRASATGLMLSFAFLVGAFSPTVLGVLKTNFGLSFALASLSFFYVLGAAIILVACALFFRKDHEEAAA